MIEKEFYELCSYLLGVEAEYHDRTRMFTTPRHDGTIRNTYKTRWNGRDPGNGRFPNCGLIRNFGNIITVNLRNPMLSGTYQSFDDALQAIGTAVGGPVQLMTKAEIEECRRLREANDKVAEAIKEKIDET